jgi:outer membrane protein assembly factor BamB
MTGGRPSTKAQASVLDLAAPLQEIWSHRQAHVPVPPIVREGRVFYVDSDRRTTAVVEESQILCWRSAERLLPVDWCRGALIGYAGQGQRLRAIAPDSGGSIREVTVPGGYISAVADESRVVGVGYDEHATVWCVDPEQDRVAWFTPLDRGIYTVDTSLVMSGETLVLAADNGDVYGFELSNGTRRWTSSVADLGRAGFSAKLEPGLVLGRPVAFQGRVIANVFPHHVVAMAAADGSRIWHWGQEAVAPRDGQLVDTEYHVLGLLGAYRILDARNGHEVFAADLARQLPRDLARVRLTRPLLVTASHILVGSETGHVVAFERESVRLAWSVRPKGAASTDCGANRFVVGRDRVYYGDGTMRIRCLGVKVANRRRPSAA